MMKMVATSVSGAVISGGPPLRTQGGVLPTVILGAGILGLSTAYHLALAANESSSVGHSRHGGDVNIVVADPASAICSGASGQCEGALGLFGFPKEITPLAELSYRLYARLAEEKDGRRQFGYSPMILHAIFSGKYDPANPRLPFPVKRQEDLSDLPCWLKVQSSWAAGLMGDESVAARVDPLRFCSFLHEECTKLGVRFLLNSEPVRVHRADDESVGGLSAIEIEMHSPDESVRVPCRNLVISAGSWSAKVFSSLFPSAKVEIHMADQQNVQNWLRFSKPLASSDEASDLGACQQVWLSPLGDNVDLHMSSFEDGDLYAAGAIEQGNMESLPPLPDLVLPSPEEVEKLKGLVSQYVELGPEGQGRELVGSGRAYMPGTSHGKPIMTKVPWNILFPDSEEGLQDKDPDGGVFMNFGHDLDGFTLGLGSGKVMAELILGRQPSVNLSPFGLPGLKA
ncbi:FAD dependent oxidoreductase [Diplogelasinospora grovesii]|uniref:FAD dependent oxidoreductase n=1 Tax=Diplogelasinospora grovesii TaxID=303347 RepID=A0AAN6S9E0_9PEZI|nr:FAD dependent oxidoreductase [Diplogelasinospora grovesii]